MFDRAATCKTTIVHGVGESKIRPPFGTSGEPIQAVASRKQRGRTGDQVVGSDVTSWWRPGDVSLR